MLKDNQFTMLDRMFKQQARGIRTPQQVVDGALGLLAYKGQFDLVEPVTRLLLERFASEVKLWAEWDESVSQANIHWMPYNDSRLVCEYFGGIAGGEYTPEQKDQFVVQMRHNVQCVANIVRGLVRSK